jgi:hypothetical protein
MQPPQALASGASQGPKYSADERNDAATYRLLVGAVPTAKRFSRVPSMFDSLGV